MTTDNAAKFDAILDLEAEVRILHTLAAFAPAMTRDDQHAAKAGNLAAARARLFAAVEALTPEEAAAFGAYRLTATA